MNNRIIKFRAWDGKQFHKERFVVTPNGECRVEVGIEHWGNIPQSGILMQFTGLLDKNGKEIYEGDIVSYHDTGKLVTKEVYYETSEVRFRWLMKNPLDTEVIGNIYENPELLT